MRQSPTSHCPDLASPLLGEGAVSSIYCHANRGFKMRQAGEPSVEDILASIKKVIARDSRGAGHEAARAPMSPAAAAAAIAPALKGAGHGGRVLLIRAAMSPACPSARWHHRRARPVRHGRPDHGRTYAPAAPHHSADSADDEDDGLVPQETTASMRDSLAALAMLAQPGAAPQIVRSGETSLEGMVREMLRPMLAEWLERNLPGMVEKMVAAEIARIAGKRG
jgi:cell pole-organizing protein PopZ